MIVGKAAAPVTPGYYYAPRARVQINLASLEELQTTPGIGPKRAYKIIKYRVVGPIKNKKDLAKLDLDGGQALIDQIAPYLGYRLPHSTQ